MAVASLFSDPERRLCLSRVVVVRVYDYVVRSFAEPESRHFFNGDLDSDDFPDLRFPVGSEPGGVDQGRA